MRIAGRPFGIIALALLATASGVYTLSALVGGRQVDPYVVGSIEVPPEAVSAIIAVWGALLLAAAVLLLAMHRWGWTLLMLVTGIGLVGALWQWWTGNLESLRLAVLVATAFYLNGRQVRDLLLRPPERASAAPLTPQEGDPQ